MDRKTNIQRAHQNILKNKFFSSKKSLSPPGYFPYRKDFIEQDRTETSNCGCPLSPSAKQENALIDCCCDHLWRISLFRFHWNKNSRDSNSNRFGALSDVSHHPDDGPFSDDDVKVTDLVQSDVAAWMDCKTMWPYSCLLILNRNKCVEGTYVTVAWKVRHCSRLLGDTFWPDRQGRR